MLRRSGHCRPLHGPRQLGQGRTVVFESHFIVLVVAHLHQVLLSSPIPVLEGSSGESLHLRHHVGLEVGDDYRVLVDGGLLNRLLLSVSARTSSLPQLFESLR